MMAMAIEEVHCVLLRVTVGMELGMKSAMRSEGRGDVLDAQRRHSIANGQRNLALTSPNPRPRGRRA